MIVTVRQVYENNKDLVDKLGDTPDEFSVRLHMI